MRKFISFSALMGLMMSVNAGLVHALPLDDYTAAPAVPSIEDLLYNYYTDDLNDVTDNVQVPYAYTDFDIDIDKTALGYWPAGTGFTSGTYSPTNTTLPSDPNGLEPGDYVVYELEVDVASIDGGTAPFNDYTAGAQDIQVYLPNIYDVFASQEFTFVEMNYDEITYDTAGEAVVTNTTTTTAGASGVVTVGAGEMNLTDDNGGAVNYNTDILIENLDPNNPVVTIVLEVNNLPPIHLDDYSNGVYHETDPDGTTEFEAEVEIPVEQDFDLEKEVASIVRNGVTIYDGTQTSVPVVTDGDQVTYTISIDPTTSNMPAGYSVYDVFENAGWDLISTNHGGAETVNVNNAYDADGDTEADETLIEFTNVDGTDVLTVTLEVAVQ